MEVAESLVSHTEAEGETVAMVSGSLEQHSAIKY